jgi:hypothetical protein
VEKLTDDCENKLLESAGTSVPDSAGYFLEAVN